MPKNQSYVAHKEIGSRLKTKADFRKDNVECVKGTFKEFKFCISIELGGVKLVAVDDNRIQSRQLTR